jgi:hypothetical protein
MATNSEGEHRFQLAALHTPLPIWPGLAGIQGQQQRRLYRPVFFQRLSIGPPTKGSAQRRGDTRINGELASSANAQKCSAAEVPKNCL